MEVWPGELFPLGAHWDGRGTNVSLFSEVATKVELCLYDERGCERRVRLPEVTAFCWHGYLPGIRPGQRYAYRVHGPWAPSDGHRCNPAKALLDPYARSIAGAVEWGPAVLPYVIGEPDAINTDDSAPYVPRSVVVDSSFDWGPDRRPRTPLHETFITACSSSWTRCALSACHSRSCDQSRIVNSES